MTVNKDPRPKEFLDVLNGIPASVAAVKRLYAVSQRDGKTRQSVRFVSPQTLSYRAFDENGKEWMRFETDGRLSTEWREEWKLPERKKGFHVPDVVPALGRLLARPDFWKGFGLGGESELPREYDVEKRTENGFAVVVLSYRGSDSIGRGQTGSLHLDAKFGLPRVWEESQSGNSPRDDGDYSRSERWTLLQVTR